MSAILERFARMVLHPEAYLAPVFCPGCGDESSNRPGELCDYCEGDYCEEAAKLESWNHEPAETSEASESSERYHEDWQDEAYYEGEDE